MVIKFLGTGTSQGIPLIGCQCPVCTSNNKKDKRLRSSLLIETTNTTLVIDTGPDFREQMLRENINRLHAILFTHAHRDHIAGLDDVRPFISLNQKPMDIYAEKHVEKDLRKIFFYAFKNKKYPGVPEFNFHRIKEKAFKINEINIIPIRGMHYKLPVLGFRIENVSYLTDINFLAQNEIEKLKGSAILILDALRKKPHISHYSLSEALSIIEQIKPQTAYLTHICHEMGLHDVIETELPPTVHQAYDGLTLTV